MAIKIKPLVDSVQKPQYATDGSSGFDILINNFKVAYVSGDPQGQPIDVSNQKSILLTPHSRVLIGAGYAIEVPDGYELQIRSRSGKALKQGLVVLNSPGTVDSDYRGEIGAILCNTSSFAINLVLGDAVAQAVLVKVERAEFLKVDELSTTTRGEGGFGSTGN